jgi:DNA-binding NarL/FixJ family response regulator
MSAVEPITVVVVDDHPIFRSGVRQLIEIEEGLRLLAEGSSGAEAIELAGRHRPDILLLDLSMKDSGLDAITAIREASPSTRVAVLTASDAADDISTAIDHGIYAYILKGATGGELLQAVQALCVAARDG